MGLQEHPRQLTGRLGVHRRALWQGPGQEWLQGQGSPRQVKDTEGWGTKGGVSESVIWKTE